MGQKQFIKENIIDQEKDKTYIMEATALLASNISLDNLEQDTDADIMDDVTQFLSTEVNDLLKLSVYCKNHHSQFKERFLESLDEPK